MPWALTLADWVSAEFTEDWATRKGEPVTPQGARSGSLVAWRPGSNEGSAQGDVPNATWRWKRRILLVATLDSG